MRQSCNYTLEQSSRLRTASTANCKERPLYADSCCPCGDCNCCSSSYMQKAKNNLEIRLQRCYTRCNLLSCDHCCTKHNSLKNMSNMSHANTTKALAAAMLQTVQHSMKTTERAIAVIWCLICLYYVICDLSTHTVKQTQRGWKCSGLIKCNNEGGSQHWRLYTDAFRQVARGFNNFESSWWWITTSRCLFRRHEHHSTPTLRIWILGTKL